MRGVQRCLFVLFLLVTLPLDHQVLSTKCTSSDSRKLYSGCALAYIDMGLWCDLTNFTQIPEPEDIKAQAPCNRALALYFNDSCLTELNSKTLQKYISLEKADFSNNLLTNISNNTFRTTRRLSALDLSKNQIIVVEENSFIGTPRLVKLNLDDNRICNLEPGVFRNMVNLKILSMNNNQMPTISEKWFPNGSKLEELYLQNNSLVSAFEPHSGQFVHLKVLQLQSNQIKTLIKENLNGLSSLKELYLNDNKITSIGDDAFEGTPELTMLDLRNNKLRSLPKDFVSALCQLRVLRLSGNKLVSLEVDWFANVLRHNPTSNLPMLEDNFWNCGCHMMGLWDLLHSMKKGTTRDAMNIVCHTPLLHHNNRLMTLSRDQLVPREGCLENSSSLFFPNKNGTSILPRKMKSPCSLRDVALSNIKNSDSTTADYDETDLRNDHTSNVTVTIFLVLFVILLVLLIFIMACVTLLRKKNFKLHKRKETFSRSNRTDEELAFV